MNGPNYATIYRHPMLLNMQRRFPDFSYITESGRSLTEHIDCLIISHFHLDHCGALPYFTEMCGYDGPIFMTHPTKAICPILLVLKSDNNFASSDGFENVNFFFSCRRIIERLQ